ncbi:hypothetical protein [Hwangdonia lutea]|uniref:Uncharacterized protein n=1 Tax=Hwangdonia lutea TaxID=3075823 RepID=A0AA97EKM3_9FLAO|nr:hypothetical protein [Hwangdonia sp. SCSIO 19198]WOD43196.1 hypothetical protein RNZ46_14490 [Hwangdonia sp. SCSIO 19198]
MKIIESEFSNHIIKSVEKDLGNIHFFNHIAVVEFNEGVHVDINNSEEIFNEINAYFGSAKPFGVIANRINSYSVKLLDADLFRKKVKNLCGYAVVSYNLAGKMNAEIENSFCLSENISYDNIKDAISHVCGKVKISTSFSLN